MITDLWVIIQLIGQISALIIFIAAFVYALKILSRWNIHSSSQKQLLLERKTYLVSVILHYVLFFQFVLLVLFIEIVKSHFPLLINGAMCAQGTLGVNDFGFPALYIKVVSLIIYSIFLFVNYLDQSEPYYPLTPAKYKIMPLLLLLIVSDFFFTFQYFNLIKPDIIATCCSISFSASLSNSEQISAAGTMQFNPLILYYIILLILLLLLIFYNKYLKWLLFTAVLYVFAAVTALKEHFIRYIYARPTHNCLFDIFWSEYYKIGFLLYGLLLFLIIAVIFMNILYAVRNKLDRDYSRLAYKLRYSAIASVLLFTLIIHLYWINWIVNY